MTQIFNGQLPVDTNINNIIEALATSNKGETSPQYAQPGMLWLDDSNAPFILKMYDGQDWIVIGELDTTAKTFTSADGSLGDNQSWTDMLNQRALNTTYTNDTGRTIFVTVTLGGGPSQGPVFIVNDSILQVYGLRDTEGVSASLPIPAGDTYRIETISDDDHVRYWWELR